VAVPRLCFSARMALPTNGRVIVETTAGELDIELWSKARASRVYVCALRSVLTRGVSCRRLPRRAGTSSRSRSRVRAALPPSALCLFTAYAGYYDGVIFHRCACVLEVPERA
jgi:cyclophilin family peptidyl-prolyl cis-trans isomerase